MENSLLIVTRNRPEELEFTLGKLLSIIDLKAAEVLVFIDGCEKTIPLIEKYPWVSWSSSRKSIGASAARARLYPRAKGKVLIGLDDDAHPVSSDFMERVNQAFEENPTAGIIAFQEIKGIFESDEKALENGRGGIENYFTNDFIGCGFAIRNEIYKRTSGFPSWIDIYGEEPCLSLEVLDLPADILYANAIIVNHRVDRRQRSLQGRNYFRFERQLRNSVFYFVVYYPNPALRIARLLFHNFKKYALRDFTFFKLYCKALFVAVISMPRILKHRKPVSRATLDKVKSLKGIAY